MYSIPYIRSVARTTPADKIKCGIETKFIRIDETWGMKYTYAASGKTGKEYRNKSYNMQKKASRFGAAPRVGSKFTLKIDGRIFYGYMTECVVDTIKDRLERGEIETRNIYHPSDVDGFNDMIRVLRNEVKITTSDMHYGNVGWMPDGRLVAIDFSEESYIK